MLQHQLCFSMLSCLFISWHVKLSNYTTWQTLRDIQREWNVSAFLGVQLERFECMKLLFVTCLQPIFDPYLLLSFQPLKVWMKWRESGQKKRTSFNISTRDVPTSLGWLILIPRMSSVGVYLGGVCRCARNVIWPWNFKAYSTPNIGWPFAIYTRTCTPLPIQLFYHLVCSFFYQGCLLWVCIWKVHEGVHGLWLALEFQGLFNAQYRMTFCNAYLQLHSSSYLTFISLGLLILL